MGLIKMYARPIKYKVNGPGTEQTAEGFVATPVRYSTISVEDLADHIAADSRVERSKVAVITDSLIKQIREMVLNGHKIVVPHLGSFKPKIKSQLAINPESVDAASFSAKVRFSPSVELKRDLQAARIEKTTLPVAPAAPDIATQKAGALVNFDSFAKKKIQEDGFELVDYTPAMYFARTLVRPDDVQTSAEIVFIGIDYTIKVDGVEEDRSFYAKCLALRPSTKRDYSQFDKTGAEKPGDWIVEGMSEVATVKEYKFTEPFSIA